MCKESRHVLKEDIQMVNKHKKTNLTSLVVREMHTKTTKGYDFIPTKIIILKKADNKKHW